MANGSLHELHETTGFAQTWTTPVGLPDVPINRVAKSFPSGRGRRSGGILLAFGLSAGILSGCHRKPATPIARIPELGPGLGYTNTRVAAKPWSIHVLEVDRSFPSLTLQSVHAGGHALGLSPLSEQLRQIPPTWGTPVGAVNGDFYQRDRPHAGDPRGLQIVNGELISAPNGGVAFWIDASGLPHAGTVSSHLQVIWSDGTILPVGLNQERSGTNTAVLYTSSAGPSTQAPNGLEIILDPLEASAAHPLAIGTTNRVRVRETRSAGNTPIASGTWVLSLSPSLAHSHTAPMPGSLLTLSTATEPSLYGARTAIGGGPILVHLGRPVRIEPPSKDSYEFNSMLERHPRTAIGWNDHSFFLVEVDGRQPDLSVGMTLKELAKTLAGLGCTDAMNLDGGGSATLWAGGTVRNSPCDGQERPIANGLVVVRLPASPD